MSTGMNDDRWMSVDGSWWTEVRGWTKVGDNDTMDGAMDATVLQNAYELHNNGRHNATDMALWGDHELHSDNKRNVTTLWGNRELRSDGGRQCGTRDHPGIL